VATGARGGAPPLPLDIWGSGENCSPYCPLDQEAHSLPGKPKAAPGVFLFFVRVHAFRSKITHFRVRNGIFTQI
jgi:hypothetical protein